MSNNIIDENDDESKPHPPNEAYEISYNESLKDNIEKNYSEPNYTIKDKDLNIKFNNNQIEKMREKITQQALRLQQIEKNYQKILLENSTLKKKINEYENDLINLNDINTKLKEKKENEKNEENEEKNINNLNIKISELIKEKSNIEKENIEKEKKLNFYINEYSKIMDLNKIMVNDKTELLKEIHEKNLEMNRKENEIEEMKNLLNQHMLDYQKEKKELLDNAYEMAKEQFIKKQEELTIKLKNKEQELERINNINIQNEKDIIQKNIYINDLENKNFQFSDNLKFNEEIKEEKEKEFKKNYSDLKEKYEEIKEENELLKKKNNDLKNNYNSIFENSKFNEKEYLTLIENYNTLKKENEKTNKFLNKVEIEKNKMEISNKNLLEENTFIKKKINEDFEKLTKEIKLLREINENLEKQNETLSNEINNINNQNRNLINEKDNSIKNKLNYEIEINELREKEKEYIHKINEIKYELEDIEKEKFNREFEINNLRNKLDLLENENNKLKNDRSDFIIKIGNLEMKNKDELNKYSYLSVKVENAKSKIKLIPYYKNLSEDLLIYLSQIKKNNPEDNIETFINYLLNEFQYLCKKIEDLNDENIDLKKIINENTEKISNLNYIIANLNKEKEFLNNNIIQLQEKNSQLEKEYKEIDSNSLDKIMEINSLKFELNEREKKITSNQIKIKQLLNLINYYETNRNNIEETIIQMSNYMRNISIKPLIRDLIQNNFDLIQIGREISLKDNNLETENIHKGQIDIKLKEISYILERLKKEFILERSLMKIYHNLPNNINNDNCDISISKVMKNDLEESKNNLIQSFSNFSSSLNK